MGGEEGVRGRERGEGGRGEGKRGGREGEWEREYLLTSYLR